MFEDRPVFKGILAGVAGGMVASWAVHRFYNLARQSSQSHSLWPYAAGAAIGAAYATLVQRGTFPRLARVPLGAALWMGEPEKTAAPPKGGRDLPEKAENLALRMAARGLRRVAERALFA
jgi:hypothetical protein